MNFFEVLSVVAIAAIVGFAVWLAGSLLLSPVRGRGCRAEVVVYASGDAPGLEHALRSAMRLAQHGGVAVTLVDCGLDEEALAVARGLGYGGRFKIKKEV